jgi:hypothetical protein
MNISMSFFIVGVVFSLAHNVLQLGEVADLKALTFNLSLNFI